MNPPPPFICFTQSKLHRRVEIYGYETHLNDKIVVKLKTKLEMHIFIFYRLYYERPRFYF